MIIICMGKKWVYVRNGCDGHEWWKQGEIEWIRWALKNEGMNGDGCVDGASY